MAVWRAQGWEADTRASGELRPVRARGRRADGAEEGRADCARDRDAGQRSAQHSSRRTHLDRNGSASPIKIRREPSGTPRRSHACRTLAAVHPRPAARAIPGEWHRRRLVRFAALLSVAVALAGGVATRGAFSVDTPRCPLGTKPQPAKERPLLRPQWLAHTVVTEYWPAPERWFVGRPVAAPGLPGLHRVDWLYSGRGLPMEGDGVALNGRRYHFGGPWHLSWVNAAGKPTMPCTSGFWSNGRPFWPAFGWRNAAGEVTFPLGSGGWSNGEPVREIQPPARLRFLAGPSLPLRYWRSIAVDPHLIPLGSRVFVPALCANSSRGWFIAQDTGGVVISGHHIDVYRPAPATPSDGGMFTEQRIFVIPAAFRGRVRSPRCP